MSFRKSRLRKEKRWEEKQEGEREKWRGKDRQRGGCRSRQIITVEPLSRLTWHMIVSPPTNGSVYSYESVS